MIVRTRLWGRFISDGKGKEPVASFIVAKVDKDNGEVSGMKDLNKDCRVETLEANP